MSDNDMIRRGDAKAICGTIIRNDEAARIEGFLDAIPAAQVTVKPLEWGWSEQVQGWRADCELTLDVFIAYQTNDKWSAGSQWLGTTYHQTADDCKSHLDQMRSARIRSALTVTPAPDAAQVAALVSEAEKAAEAIDMAYGAEDDDDPHRHSSKLRAALAAMNEG